ncbi:MAG: HD-GYP domain-containing protein, partial [Halanaerobiales bacterium]
VQGLINILEVKSYETKEHALRMTKLAFEFGEKLNLSNSELNRLSLLSTLHDIGKITIPEKILKKPAKLTAEEWVILKEHSERGYKIAAASEEFAAVAEDILSHHERWDGSGYPNGLEGKNIPYLARIISVIDAYDVMTHDRPYSSAISEAEALKEIKKCAGSQFDPELAKKFRSMMI